MPSVSTSPCMSSLGRWSVSIPWNRARDLQTRLRKRGCPSTVCLDYEDKIARLEPWPEVDPSQFMAELNAITL
ncbi:MAG: hypothetical protein LC104_04600 [Bacteroidales bacterium]|nr:hypothetical protein [Bacteroidales bacterium]